MARLSTKTPAKKPAAKPAAVKAATAKPAAKTAAASPAKAPASSAGKTATAAKRAPAGATKTTFTPEERYRMVAEAAYYHAERHGFMGDPVQDWIAAEKQIEALLSGKKKK